MKRKPIFTFFSALALLLAGVLIGSASLYAQDDLNDLIVQRKNVQKQVDAMVKNDKTFKNKVTYAEYLSAFKKLMDLDEQIILAANYSMNALVKERDEALKKASGGGVKTVIKTVPVKVPGSSAVNDSLANALTSLQFQASNINNIIKEKDKTMMRLATKADSLETENKKFAAKFDELNTSNKNLEEKNLILMIFNSLVVIGLIMSLFFLLRKPVAKKLMFNEPASKPLMPVIPEQVVAAAEAQAQAVYPPIIATPQIVAPSQVQITTPPVQVTPMPEPERVIKRQETPKSEPVFKVSSEGILAATHDSLDVKLDQIEKLARLKEKGYITNEEFDAQKKQILGS